MQTSRYCAQEAGLLIPSIQTSTDSAASAGPGTAAPWPPQPGRSPQASACEPYREAIEQALARHRDGAAIYRDLVDDHGFMAGYASVQRFVRRVRAERATLLPDAHPVIETAAGEEAQVDPAALRELRSLARQALAERKAERPPAAARKLFRRLREAFGAED